MKSLNAQQRKALIKKINGRLVVASVSGGKDSAALSLWLTENGIKHRRVFMDTGWEHPTTYDYLRGELREKLGPIDEIRGPLTFEEVVRKKGMFPYRTTRFCTSELKILPIIEYIRAIVNQEHVDVVNAVGIRREESRNRSTALEWEWQDDYDCEVWRPLVDWTVDDVVEIHKLHGLRPNPLYLAGAERVGCWPCIHARKEEIARLPESRLVQIRKLETEVQGAARARAEAKGEELRNPPTFFTLRVRVPNPDLGGAYCDDNGNACIDHRETIEKHVTAPIDDVVAWAKTGKGGKQMMLLDNGPNEGCFRWGLCDTGASSAKGSP